MRNIPNVEELFIDNNKFEFIRADALANNPNIHTLCIDGNADLESIAFIASCKKLQVSSSHSELSRNSL